jgi:antagonist of KipI
MSIRVLRPGLLTTVQDHGRRGLQHLGVVPGGAMDGIALSLANALVGNSRDQPALEITVLGPELLVQDEALVALCGAEMEASADGEPFPADRPVLVAAGTRLSIRMAMRGVRAYFAVAGGFALDPVLGSTSTYLAGRFGGLEGRALKRDDVLPLARDVAELSARRYAALSRQARRGRLRTVRWSAPPLTLPDREPIVVHAMEGHHFAAFEPASQHAFFDAVWRVAPDSNRMGYRLAGPELVRAGDSRGEILSGPTALGTVQVPSNGSPILLMADHQTTGGYPRIAEIASADVPRVAQIAPGGRLHFARCTLETAIALRGDARERVNAALRGLAWEYAKAK